MIKRHFFLIAAVALVALMVVAGGFRLLAGTGERPGGGGRGGPGGPGGRAQAVTPVAVEPRPFSNQIEVLGVAKGRESLTVTSSTTELITKVLFRDGQWVRKGAPLVELQAREEDAGIVEARAAVAGAEQALNRWRNLAAQGVAPRINAEQAETAYRSAQAQLQAALARRGDRVIRAPFAGVIGLSDVTAGTLINPGSRIATLDDIGVIRVDFPVPERYLPVLRQGLPLTATAEGVPGRQFAGRISLVDTRIDERTRAVTARADFPNPGFALRPGMTLRVSIEQGMRISPAVPEAAVQFEGDTAFAYRIAGAGGKLTAQRVDIRRGDNQGGFVEVLEGLQVGDRVIAGGLNRIQPNGSIRIAGQGRAGGGAGAGGGAQPGGRAGARATAP
ncbi:MAG TPA: efflux RND transporter periplasmic adaptor subunit [Caulobacteraceae bacterium]